MASRPVPNSDNQTTAHRKPREPMATPDEDDDLHLDPDMLRLLEKSVRAAHAQGMIAGAEESAKAAYLEGIKDAHAILKTATEQDVQTALANGRKQGRQDAWAEARAELDRTVAQMKKHYEGQ
jgi:hypothetical protein